MSVGVCMIVNGVVTGPSQMQALENHPNDYLRLCIGFVTEKAVWGELEMLSKDMQASKVKERPSLEEAVKRARVLEGKQYDVCH